MENELILEVSEYKSPDRWLWRLKDAAGNFIDKHQVDLKDDGSEDCGYRGYHDLTGYLKHLAKIAGDGDRRKGEELLLEQVGRWMGEHVLGWLRLKLQEQLDQTGGALPIRVELPVEAQDLISRPLELAWLSEGRTLAEAGARLIWHPSNAPDGSAKKNSEGRLRVLGVYSLPTSASPLNLRKERVAFKGLLHTIAATQSLAIETRVLQYGTTRKALRDILREAPGWDIVHFSCHGREGALLLEDEKGENDLVPASELHKLLKTSKARLKLIILSACLSGAGLSHEEARVLLGLSTPTGKKDEPHDGDADEPMGEKSQLPSLAQDLARTLDCAVLAMRYPVGDEFAIDLTAGLFREMLENHQPMTEATQMALDDALGGFKRAAAPAESPITPMLVGWRAAALQFEPPEEDPDFDLKMTGLVGFPRPPEHFVGRVGPMLRASKALAPESGRPGVLFHGMAGGGKTACAVELAHLHDHRRRFTGFVWFKCPDEGEDFQTTLLGCLTAIENQLGLDPATLIGNIDDPQLFKQRTVPMVKKRFEKSAILVVIDNMESLLSDQGAWLDDKWGDFLDALLNHGGLSRVVLTSRRVPANINGDAPLLRENITALNLSESLLLARELPHLREFLEDDSKPAQKREADLKLLTAALEVIQGHPKLLELADNLAADRKSFADMVKKAREKAQHDGAPLQAFLKEGESDQEVADFTRAFNGWTTALLDTLTPAARLVFQFLCRLEEDDRRLDFININWGDFLTCLHEEHGIPKKDLPEPAGSLEPALEAIVTSGLAGREVRTVPSIEVDEDTKEFHMVETEHVTFSIHPGVAEAGRKAADRAVLDAADWELGEFHLELWARGMQSEMEGGGGTIVAAARRAVPYLIRNKRWEEASMLLDNMIRRNPSPSALSWAIPILRHIVLETEGTKEGLQNAGVLANTLLKAMCYDEAETLLRDILARREEQGDWSAASANASYLVNLLQRRGRFKEALDWVGRAMDFARRAGQGPWSQLGIEVQRLQILNAMGRCSETLEAVQAKRRQMDQIPEKSEADEKINPWQVREVLLDVGHSAAVGLEGWETALELNAEIIESQRGRGAGEHRIVKTIFNDNGPLLRLRRFDEARRLLENCREVFETERDYDMLGRAYSALADLESEQGHPATAVRFEKAALKYKYQTGDPESCGISHNNLAEYMETSGEPPDVLLGHRLAAGIISIQSISGFLSNSINNIALSDLPDSPPAFDAMADAVEQFEGVHFRELFAALPTTYPDGDSALTALWEEVHQEKEKSEQEEETRQAVLASLPSAVRVAFDLDGEEFSQALNNALDALPENEREDVHRRLSEANLIGSAADSGGGDASDEFEKLLSAIAAIALGEADDEMRSEVEAALKEMEQDGWRLREAAQRIWNGERDAQTLTTDLAEQDTQLVRRILELIEESSGQDESSGTDH